MDGLPDAFMNQWYKSRPNRRSSRARLFNVNDVVELVNDVVELAITSDSK